MEDKSLIARLGTGGLNHYPVTGYATRPDVAPLLQPIGP